MTFKSCDVDSRIGNTLTSPEFTLQSDQELTFMMLNPPSGYNSKWSLYQTSVTGHPTTLLGTYTPASPYSSYDNTTNNDTNSFTYTYGFVTVTHTVHTVCLPTGTYQLVFIAADLENDTDWQTGLTSISLTDASCTFSPLSANGK